ncbi:DEAD/DEAH box helicase family protein [Staphylococcus epidermidis]|uniref:restriction endonuclease n=1 Tax=Staphylococcus epidermidis TaxID=1282 RepID=UPI00066E68AF|nr:DEAD/DEAH box helicase family protein [Staphylococcus epidermidis]MBM6129025.1 DEAD/DEAH box helicase family protein [Staphylococcus epidermidis]MCG1142030.1 DEAD/DEAH box helicase family protein [Staphylococcus epidermidis]MCG1346882.1 DEAD/DEAH box helicase family protein [Staphylococcus epidermidis]MCG1494150.1 DEAD/DEAH box helicase family protein [Staphylococcus epidermidis]MCG1507987.1 DEAD/DEAH box helicase family protein [Staphylococcus epidermidis]
MKFQYKDQQFQVDAVNAVTSVFEGQPKQTSSSYVMDIGDEENVTLDILNGFKNLPISLSNNHLLENIKSVQRDNGLIIDNRLIKMAIGGKDKTTEIDNSCEKLTLSVEMETGTGKTYTYIKTIFELNKQYGWSKFIIVVPNIAIREGIAKTFESTAEHFKNTYGISIRSFIYNSKHLNKIDAFAGDAGINVMIVNTQAFNARGADARRIDMELDQFRGRRPIDVIAATNPIMIIDEPQSVLGNGTKSALNATRVGLAKFNPLFFINYSATHRENYNMVYRLDAVDAYKKQLVKKIAVKGIEVSGSSASNGYLYIESIIEKPNLKVRVQFERISPTGKIVKTSKLIDRGTNIYQLSNEIEAYRSGFVVSEINAIEQYVEFTNGLKLDVGEVVGNTNDEDLRRIQIRETIHSHLDKEARLFKRGIKTLSLFFIDEVVKYKNYEAKDDKGTYALIFEEEYENIVRDRLVDTMLDQDYRNYLKRELNSIDKVHAGYFSVDKKGKMINSKIKRGSEASDDISAYDLIMKNKERLLSFDEPVRFIFSHSALKEGWDNPNVFQIATLRQSSSDIKKRQEIGRGLRLSINQNGERQDAQVLGENEVQQLNILTIIANESYEKFARDLQSEIADAIKNRPKLVEPRLFEGRELTFNDISDNNIVNKITIDNTQSAEIWTSLKVNNIITKEKQLSDEYKALSKEEQRTIIEEALDKEYQPFTLSIQKLINSVYDSKDLPIENENKRVTLQIDKEKYASSEFKDLWSKINRKSYYTVDFDDEEIISKSIEEINKSLTVATLKAYITEGNMIANDNSTKFNIEKKTTTDIQNPVNRIKYDLIGEISQNVGLLRKTVGQILLGIHPEQFAKYKLNPESFIFQISNIINSIKAQNIVSHIIYNKLDEVWDEDAIFVDSDIQGIIGQNVFDAKKHLYDKVKVDSNVEKSFAEDLDVHQNVEMYVKLPGGFFINTPVGKYNPDWAIVLNEVNKKHIYFIAETKGTSDNISLNLKGVENAKIESARQHFKVISNNEVTYDVVDSYEKLIDKLSAN